MKSKNLPTIITQEVLDFYGVPSAKMLPEHVRNIKDNAAAVCITNFAPGFGQGKYITLCFSDEWCEREGFVYVDYCVIDETFNDIDSGLVEIPCEITNLVDAFEYAFHEIFEDLPSKRELWCYVCEEAVSARQYQAWHDKVV